jgi:Transcriptional regulatory protein, C terminal
LTKMICLIDYGSVPMGQSTEIQLPGAPERADAAPACPWDARGQGPHSEQGVPQPGRDAALLAVVPIPGTGTSLAIVGYMVSTAGPRDKGPETVPETTASAADEEGSGLVVDRAQRRVWAEGCEIPLTFREFELLAFLSAHPATVFRREDLVETVWQHDEGRDLGRNSRTVDVHVSRLRTKLGPVYGRCLVTEYRVGYQFRPLAP